MLIVEAYVHLASLSLCLNYVKDQLPGMLIYMLYLSNALSHVIEVIWNRLNAKLTKKTDNPIWKVKWPETTFDKWIRGLWHKLSTSQSHLFQGFASKDRHSYHHGDCVHIHSQTSRCHCRTCWIARACHSQMAGTSRVRLLHGKQLAIKTDTLYVVIQ